MCLGFESRHQMKTHVTKTKVCLINNNIYSIYKAQHLVRRDYSKRLHADTDTHRHRRIDRQTDRQTDRHRQTETETQTDRQTDTHTHIHTQVRRHAHMY